MWDLPRKASIGPSNGFSAAASVGTKLAQMIKPAKKGVQYFNMASSSIAVSLSIYKVFRDIRIPLKTEQYKVDASESG